MEHRNVHQMIDACRPGSRDIDLSEMSPLADQMIADPELHHRYLRTQQLDARLAGAIDEVSVPDGLRERILARLRESPGSTAPIPPVGTAARAEPSRRRWLIAIAAVAASLLLLAGGYAFWPRPVPLTYDRLLDLSSQWYEQLQDKPGWQSLAPGAEIRDFPLAEGIRARPLRWADMSSLVGQPACAYDLPIAGNSRAALFVIPADRRIAGSTLPFNPASSTGGLMIGCWQSREFVYVLVVEGNELNYRRMFYDAVPSLAAL